MSHFTDYTQNVSKQTFSCAAIVDSKGKLAGKVIIRFTPSQIGYNHNVGVLFSPAGRDFSMNRKGGTYDQPSTLFQILDSAGVDSYTHSGKLINLLGGNGVELGSLSQFNEIQSIKYKGESYNLLWVM